MSRNDVGPYLRMCLDCLEVFPREDFKKMVSRCDKCAREYRASQKEMSDKKAVVDACRTVTRALATAQRDKEPAALPGIMNAFLQKIGGAEKVGQLLTEDFNRLRGVGLTEEELMKHEFKEGTLQRYWQMLLRGMTARDEQVSQVDLQGFTDEELKATLIPLAANLLVEDAEFRLSVLREAIHHDPNIMDELLRERMMVVDQPKPTPKPTPKIVETKFTPETLDVDPAELAADEAN